MRNVWMNSRFGLRLRRRSRSLVRVLLKRIWKFGGNKGSLQLADKAFSGKKGYLYFTLPSRLLQHGHWGERRLAMYGDSESRLLESGPSRAGPPEQPGLQRMPEAVGTLLHNGAAASAAAVCLGGWMSERMRKGEAHQPAFACYCLPVTLAAAVAAARPAFVAS